MFKQFSESEITDLYNTYVKHRPASYYYSHTSLYKHVMNLNLKDFNPETSDYPRLASIIDFKNWFSSRNLTHFQNVLSTCRHDPELQLINYSNIDYAEYDGKSNDLHTLDLPKKDYDLVVVNQTLEHVYNPFQCVKNIYDHIKPGGYFFTSVPMINIDHNLPFYYWGINPTGLALMCKSQGFEVLEVGFWGNRDYILNLFGREPWPSVRSMGGDKPNDPNFICQCWILCIKNDP